MDARGVILYGASISTSGRLGLGKEENYAYEIYELEFIPEVLYGVSYRKSLTTLFPRFLKAMANYHEGDIKRYFKDAFGYEGSVAESVGNELNFLRLGLNSMQQYRIKFILAKITAYVDALRMGKNEVSDLSNYTETAVEIEHIMPQTCNNKAAYGVTDDEYNVYINRLGNLTLLENSIAELKTMIWRYYMSYWNNRRICSANGGLPPAVKRKKYYESLVSAA